MPSIRWSPTAVVIPSIVLLFVTCCGAASSTLEDEFREIVREDLAKVRHQELPLVFNGEYFILGSLGRIHEQVMAKRYTQWMKANEGLNFLFMPRFGKMSTPGIDGTTFTLDATRPEKRVTFKSVERLGSLPALRLIQLIKEATEAAERHSTLDGTFYAAFPNYRDEELPYLYLVHPKPFMNKLLLLAAMGLNHSSAIPIVVVVDIIEPMTSEQLNLLLIEMRLKLNSWNMLKPQQVVLMSADDLRVLTAGVDYSIETRSGSCVQALTSPPPEHSSSNDPPQSPTR